MMPIILDRKLFEDVGGSPHATEPDMFGIEVELEGMKIQSQKDSIMKYWGIHQDNSLRANKPGSQCCEYVFFKPLVMEDTKKALTVLFDYLNGTPGVEVFDSYRTSVHVHVNCLQDTIRTVVNFLTLSIIFDELLVSQNGETRIGNNFCLRSKDAEGQIADIVRSVSQHGSIFNLSPNDRYSSTNFSSLVKFGTVEFRSLEGTTDYKRVMHWVKTLQALKEAARTYENPREIIAKFSRRGPLGFIVSSLGEQYEKYTKVAGSHMMLHNGMRLAQDFAFCSDWRQPEKGELKPSRNLKIRVPKAIGGVGDAHAEGIAHYQALLAQMNAQAQHAQVPQNNGGAQWVNHFAEPIAVPGQGLNWDNWDDPPQGFAPAGHIQ